MFRVNGHELIGSRERGLHERAPRHQGLLIGKSKSRAGGNRREGGPQPHGTSDAVQHHIGADARRLDYSGGTPHHLDPRQSRRITSGDHCGNGRSVGHCHEPRTHRRDLSGKCDRIRPACGESDHFEAIRVSRNDVQSLNAD